MKILQVLLFMLALSVLVNAQADCGFDFKLFIRDSNGKMIQNAKIELKGEDFYYNDKTRIYSAWSLFGVGAKYDSVLQVEAKGFNKFIKQIELQCGFYAYDLKLSAKNTSEVASFEELARISGKVVDRNDGEISNVRVVLSNAKGEIKETVTNENGYYSFILPSGKYSIEFIGTDGFAPKKYKDIELLKGINNLDVALEVKSCDDPSIICTVLTSDSIKSILTGSVYDANGAVIIKAKITAINEKGKKFETLTNDDGIYILNLPYNPYRPGNIDFKIAKYEIIVEKEHFEKTIIKNFKFAPAYDGKVNLDFALDVYTYDHPIIIDSNTIKNNKEEK